MAAWSWAVQSSICAIEQKSGSQAKGGIGGGGDAVCKSTSINVMA